MSLQNKYYVIYKTMQKYYIKSLKKGLLHCRNYIEILKKKEFIIIK
jgi:hypothetical protein